MKLSVEVSGKLPVLAWILEVNDDGPQALVGSRVEFCDQWLVEGVWDGAFELGDFDRTEAFWGSGVRVRDDSVIVVPSVSTTDRVLYCVTQRGLVVSNSLPALLSQLGVRLDAKTDYLRSAYALQSGVFSYDDRLATSRSDLVIRVLVHQNLCVEAGKVALLSKSSVRQFESFAEYTVQLRAVVGRIGENLAATRRTNRMTPVATASSGYDSACCAVFAKHAGAKICYTSRESNSLRGMLLGGRSQGDSGESIALQLGLECRFLSRYPSLAEVEFRSASAIRPELAFTNLTQFQSVGVGIVFTGFYGDTAWGMTDPAKTDDELKWAEPSGYSISEGRLHLSYINLALPFLFGRSRESLARISSSVEMRPWSIGGGYDRPIPRRILEENGVARSMFGREKRAILNLEDRPVNRDARTLFYRWLSACGPMSAFQYATRERANRWLFYVLALRDKVLEILTRRSRYTPRDMLWTARWNPQSLMLLWASTTVADRIATHGETTSGHRHSSPDI